MSRAGFYNFIIFYFMRWIRYSRKSSEGNESQVQSIPDQNAVLDRLARDQNLNVVYEFEEAKSAKRPGIRPVFAQMIELIESGKADAILCWHLNRLSRNPVDSGKVEWLSQEGIIKCIRTPFRDYLPEDNLVIMAVENAGSSQFIRDMKVNIRRGQAQKVARGWYPRKPPGGYFTNRETGEIEVDPERFRMLRRAWEMVLSEAYSVREVHRKLGEWGYTTRLIHRKSLRSRPGKMITESHLYETFKNRFYVGEFTFEGHVHQGKHQPMVTREEYARAQEIISGVDPIHPKRHTFAYTGLIRCGGCGCMVTAERKVKKYPKTNRTVSYTYYHCTRSKSCTEPAVTVDYVEQVIAAKLARCHLNPEAVQWSREALISQLEQPDSLPDRLRQGEAKLQAVRSKLQELLELRLSGEISADELQTLRAKYQAEADKLECRLERLKHFEQLNRQTIDNLLSYVASANALFRDGDEKVKRQIARLMADHYLLTLGELRIQPHPLLEPLLTLEPPHETSGKVHSGPLAPQIPFLCTWVDHIRTLLATKSVAFAKLDDEEQVRLAETEIARMKRRSVDPGTLSVQFNTKKPPQKTRQT